jgi:hypothetical protein
MPFIRFSSIVCLLSGLHGSVVLPAAGQHPAVPLGERARTAERVVVGRVGSIAPAWQVNEFGDRLIVSTLRVTIEETLKGEPQSSVNVEVEGGTIGDLTLRVSDVSSFAAGDRAVFYLTRNPRGALVPHLRGQGVLKLDRSDRVADSTVTLADVRRSVAAGRAR